MCLTTEAKTDRTARRNKLIHYHIGNFNILISEMDRYNMQKIIHAYKRTVELQNIINQVDLINIYRLLHPTTEEIFFSSSQGTFTKIDYIWIIKHTLIN